MFAKSVLSLLVHWLRRPGWLALVALMAAGHANALPLFARQTGHSCQTCHAGGQFPELTPYGRIFKLTGYTLGARTSVPLAVMGVFTAGSYADTSNMLSPTTEKNATPIFATGSLFAGGKITDNIGLFSQITFDPYTANAAGTGYSGHTHMDNVDLRFADRYIGPDHDWIFGVSVNNTPSVTDPWNTAPAWMNYVPLAGTNTYQYADGSAPYPGYGVDQAAGVNAYVYWNKTLYGEIGFYRTANQGFSILSYGSNDGGTNKLKGANNPYWRLAYTREWGAHNIMVGASGMLAHLYDGNIDTSDPNDVERVKSTVLDAQYQYLLDPHTVTAQLAYMKQRTDYSFNSAPQYTIPYDTTNVLRGKLTYVYDEKYGGSLGYFSQTGTTWNAPPGSLPGMRGMTYEAFFMPVQNIRIGAQYTNYQRHDDAVNNGRNPADNNTLLLYLWAAY